MKVGFCSGRKILQHCSLELFSYQIDPYIGCEHNCHYCYTLNQPETETEEILLHRDLTDQLEKKLPEIEPQTIYMGMDTDPYQPSENEYKQTRKVLQMLAKRGFSVCILTKSDLVLRDIDLISGMRASSIGTSIAFQDEETRRLFEDRAPPNKNRLEALKVLKETGIETYALISPAVPFVTDVEALIDMSIPVSDTIWIYGLRFEDESDRNWQNVKKIMDERFPLLAERCRKIAFYPDHPYWGGLRERLISIQQKRGLNLRIEL